MRPNAALLCGALLFGLVLPSVIARRRVEIIEEPDEPEDDFPCPEQFGYFSDPANCSRYHICDHGKASLKTCDDGLVFSTILKTCDWPYNVQCNTADAEFTGRTLRLRGNSEETTSSNGLDQSDQLPTNRRQPVLAYEDDSYWLGRPETTLLALDDEDDFVDNYHYEEPQRIPSKKQQRPKNIQRQPPQERRQEVSREESENNDEEGNGGPWFHSLNFDQIRRQEDRKPSMFRRIENNTTPVRSTTTTTTTPVPFVSTNQRGGGWRHTQRNRQPTQPQTRTTTELPQLLPRKALRVGNSEDDLSEDVDINKANEDNSEFDQDVPRRQKDSQDSYRLVPTTARAQPTSTVAPPESPRPLHLGSSRRRVNRKQQTNSGGNQYAPTSTTPKPTTTEEPARPWNARAQPVHNQRTPVVNNRARNPAVDNPFKQFERRPVLRDSEDAPTRDNFEDDSGDDDGLDDSAYFATPLEISKKITDDDETDRRSASRAKDVSNSLDSSSRRSKPSRPTTTQAPPKPPKKVDQENIYRAFQAGFNQAVKPTPAGSRRTIDDDGNTFRMNPSVDMEYEEVANEDEDENVEDADNNGNNNEDSAPESNIHTNRPNKEIVVRYDDEEEEPSVARKPVNQPSRNAVAVRPATVKYQPFTTPAPITRPASPTPPRLTQFVDIVVRNNNNNNPPVTPASRPASNPAIHVLDLLAKQKKVVNPNARSILNFGFVPTLGSNSSLIFFPPPPTPSISPKQPRHTSSLDPVEKPQKKTQKVKPNKKSQAKSNKNEFTSSKPKKFHKVAPLPKTFQKGHYNRAKRCVPEQCQPPNCRCGGTDIPGGFAPNETPQIVLLTFDDSVNDLNREIYKKLFEQGRKNPNGCPIRSTFYVSHEWTDYSQVQNLYAKGHEMASHSISHSFGEKFSKERWLSEIAGQREIMHLYGGVDWRDIRGMRAPFLQTGGNTMFEMLKEANFSYDSSMPVYDIDPPYWPYTFDYTVGHDCMIEPCPTNSIPGLWEVGMVMWEDLRGGRCSMADGCFNPSDEEGVYNMVKQNFFRHYNSNRAPFGMFFHSRWFLTDHNMKGFVKFLDEMLQMKDVYVVSNWQMINWMKRPMPLSALKSSSSAFACDDIRDRPSLCKAPHTCKVRFRGEMRTLRTCSGCPRYYPWTGNNGLEDEAEAP